MAINPNQNFLFAALRILRPTIDTRPANISGKERNVK